MLHERHRLIALQEGAEVHDSRGVEAAFEDAWLKIVNDEPLVCAKTGTTFEHIPVVRALLSST